MLVARNRVVLEVLLLATSAIAGSFKLGRKISTENHFSVGNITVEDKSSHRRPLRKAISGMADARRRPRWVPCCSFTLTVPYTPESQLHRFTRSVIHARFFQCFYLASFALRSVFVVGLLPCFSGTLMI